MKKVAFEFQLSERDSFDRSSDEHTVVVTEHPVSSRNAAPTLNDEFGTLREAVVLIRCSRGSVVQFKAPVEALAIAAVSSAAQPQNLVT